LIPEQVAVSDMSGPIERAVESTQVHTPDKDGYDSDVYDYEDAVYLDADEQGEKALAEEAEPLGLDAIGLPPLTGPVNEQNVERFQSLLCSMIQFIHAWVKEHHKDVAALQYKERALAISFLNQFQYKSSENIFKAVIAMIAPQVQSILGQPGLQAVDLLKLPEIPDKGTLWGVYLDVPTTIVQHTIKGVYNGSSVAELSYPGIRGRTAQHLYKSKRSFDSLRDRDKCRHYRVICQQDVQPNFRQVGLCLPAPQHIRVVVLLEGLMCVYLNTLPDTPSDYYSEASIHLAIDIRRHASNVGHGDLPDFSALGLNGASPLQQGPPACSSPEKKAHLEWAQTHPDVCGNSACRKPRNRKSPWHEWHGFKEDSRCKPCYRYLEVYEKDDPNPYRYTKDYTFEDHQKWLENPANRDVCARCGAGPRPEDYHNKKWRYFCELSLCGKCYNAKYRGNENPEHTVLTLDQREHRHWVAQGNPDICYGAGCGKERPQWGTAQAKSWTGFRDKARCPNCQQKERNADPNAKKRVTAEDHKQWVAQGNPNVCGGCGATRPENKEKGHKQWTGYCENSRCGRCVRKRKKERELALAQASK
jgi:hypothetical protein